jgi:hypothetical protein
LQHCVTIRAGSEPGVKEAHQILLRSGESAVFGTCACERCCVDLLVGAGSAWLAGEVTATEGHWCLSNLTSRRSLLVENLENPFEYLTVAPRRRCAPVAFELARVCASDDPAGPTVTVFGPEPTPVGRLPRPCPSAATFRPPLDRGSTYFAVLQALCESRLNASPAAPLPTSDEIATHLRERRPRLTARAVDAHIEYVSEKLGLCRGTRRDVLVATAIRRGLVSVR